MTLTLLLDLDDTLLENNFDTFLPAYLKELGKHLMGYVAPELMVRHLLAATAAMMANNTATLSLERSFDRSFYPAIGHSKEELRDLLEQFYDDVFPGLQQLTSQRPEAIRLVEYALERDHTLVIATNPLFPRKAILHRLRWAGLDPDRVPFALITTYEQFHYPKPNPAYFAEILAQLGWPDQPAAVIGDSMEYDLLPASRLGLPVFWITSQATPLPDGFHPLSASGSLAEVPAWLERVDLAALRQNFSTPAGLLAVLKSTPAALDTISTALSERQWMDHPQPEEWSLTQIFCHLRDVDGEVNIPRLERTIAGENPFLPGINTDTWAVERSYDRQDGPEALRQFIALRSQLVSRLEALAEESWQLPARHAIFGPTNIKELVSFIVTHDQSHIKQVLAAVRMLAAPSGEAKEKNL